MPSTSTSPPSRSSARRGIMRSATARWASACTTTSPWRRRTRWPAASTAWRSSTSTCTTATGPSGSSTTIPACSTSRLISSRSIRAPGRQTRSGARRAPGSPSTCRWKRAPPMPTIASCSARPSFRCSAGSRRSWCSSRPAIDAHERDPLASMRMTAHGYRAIVRQLTAAAPNGAIAFVTEGGYDLSALASCLDASFEAIAGSGFKAREVRLSRMPPSV